MTARRLGLGLLIAAGFITMSALSAPAQDVASCMVGMKVKNKPVILDLVPGATAAQVMSCEKAEAWREQFYIANQKVIDAAASGNSAFYVSELEKTLAARQKAITDLEQAIANNASKSTLAVIAKVMIGEASKSDALLTCTKSPKSASCIIGIIGMATFFWDVVSGDIAKDRFREEIDKQKKQLIAANADVADLKKKMASIDMSRIRKDVEQTFVGMCASIRRDCLN